MPTLAELLAATVSQVADLDDDGRVLIRCNASGTMQVVEIGVDGSRRVLTEGDEPVALARYRPGHRELIIERDSGGDERFQLLRGEIDDGDGPVLLTAITTDSGSVHRLGGLSRDGLLLAYSSNRRNGVDFDLFVRRLDSGDEWCVYDSGGWCEGQGFSPDSRLLLISRPGARALDDTLLLVPAGPTTTPPEPIEALPHDEPAVLEAPQWLPDSSGFYIASNLDRDRGAVIRCDIGTGETATAVDTGWDCLCYLSRDGATLLVASNEDGATVGRIHDTATMKVVDTLQLSEPGVLAWSYNFEGPHLSAQGDEIVYTVTSPREPGDVWRWRRGRGSTRLTSTSLRSPESLVQPELRRVSSFDGESVPLFLYPPAVGDGPAPVVVWVHGGPESQSGLMFAPVIQALSQAGYAVVVPNVRGSTGYGKRYAALDDGRKRLESVADLAAIHAALESMGLDPRRAALMGGSYGGYMTLAGLAFQPQLWAAGVDIVGISSLVTFLRNTAGYRRSHREREYGSLAADLDFLEAASPLTHVERIRVPLLAIHGANDPRVPVAETEQIVASLQRRGVPARLLVYPDEGHGLNKRRNQLDAYPQVIAFLDEVLRL